MRPDQRGCGALAPSAPQLLFTTLAVAAAMLGTFHAWLAATLDWEEVYLDIARGRMMPVKRALTGRPVPARRRWLPMGNQAAVDRLDDASGSNVVAKLRPGAG